MKSVAEAMYDYYNARERYESYQARTGYDRLPHAPTIARLGKAMEAAEREVDESVRRLVRPNSVIDPAARVSDNAETGPTLTQK